jgi:hypothetical protein
MSMTAGCAHHLATRTLALVGLSAKVVPDLDVAFHPSFVSFVDPTSKACYQPMQPPNFGRDESTDQSGGATLPNSQRMYISESHSTTSPLFRFVGYNEESKVFAVQQAFISAYRCVVTIVEPEPEMRSMGWVALSRTVEILRRHVNHSRVREVFDMDTLLGKSC